MPTQTLRRRATPLLAILCAASHTLLAASRPWQPPYPAENLLPNSSFEESQEAREIYPIIGEYRHRTDGQWAIDRTRPWHGRQCLRMQGTQPFFWQALNWDSKVNVFSVYLRGSKRGQKVELGFELLSFVDDGAVVVEGRQRRVVEVNAGWRRYEVASTIERKREVFVRLHLFRSWVRPLSSDQLWVDAAQIEKGRRETTPYKPDRGYNELSPFLKHAITNPIVSGPTDLPSYEGKRSKTGTVTLTVRETDGVSRDGEPVWGGVPFPAGELFDERTVRLFDRNGAEVPCQTRALARRHINGSITSLLVDFQASVPARGAERYELRYGTRPRSAAHAIGTTNDTGQIVLHTGAARAAFDGKGTATFAGANARCYVTAMDGTVFRSDRGRPDALRLEANGPLHAIAYLRGKHWAKDGDTAFLDYELRVHAFAGKPYFLIETTFENREPALNTSANAICLQLPTPATKNATCRFGVVGGKDVVCPREATLTQLHNYYGRGRYDLALDSAEPKLMRNARASGRLSVGPTTVTVQDFWQRNPKALSRSSTGIHVYHWPGRHVKLADLPFGMSNTLRVMYAPSGRAPSGARLLLQVDPEWVASSGVFGHFLTDKEAREHYPRFNRRVNDYFAALPYDRLILDLTGTFDYGDMGQPGCWMNNETTVGQHLWTQYLRTGDPALYRRAEIMSLHTRDVDICHLGQGSRLMHHPSGGFHTTQSWHIGHYWITGLIYHYLLTGDQRTLNVVRDVGAGPMIKYRNFRYTGRERSRMLYHLAELYDLTHLRCFRHAFETHYNAGKPTPTSDYAGGCALLALKRWYDTTGGEQYLARFKRDAATFLRERTKDPLPDVGSGRGWYLFSAMGEAARVLRDHRYIDAFHDRLIWYLVSTHGFDHSSVRGLDFLEAAHRLGVKEHPWMPEQLLGIDIFTGVTGKFNVRIHDERDLPFVVKVYRTRNFRAGQSKRQSDVLAFRLTKPDGTVVAEEKLGGREYAFRTLTVPPDGQKGHYLATIECMNNGQGALSCSVPTTFLDARQSFHFRRIRCGAGLAHFALRAPRKEPSLRIRLRWRDMPGQGVGLWLCDADANPVAQARWVVPMGFVLDEEGNEIGHADCLELPVPERYRGTRLTITITAVKWMGWQLDGLDLPWLTVP